MPERRRPALRPLPPDLTGPVRAFAERLRTVYWERTEFNQRELGAALHLTKSPISRYLNGQEVMPAPTLEQFCALAHLTPPERDALRTLRARADKAPGNGAPVEVEPPPRWRRIAWWALPLVVVLAGVGITLVLVNSGGSAGSAGCPQAHRQYTVTADGDVLDVNRNDIGDVHRGDTFTLDTPPTNPYQARHFGHVGNLTGFVDQAKLRYTGDVCG